MAGRPTRGRASRLDRLSEPLAIKETPAQQHRAGRPRGDGSEDCSGSELDDVLDEFEEGAMDQTRDERARFWASFASAQSCEEEDGGCGTRRLKGRPFLPCFPLLQPLPANQDPCRPPFPHLCSLTTAPPLQQNKPACDAFEGLPSIAEALYAVEPTPKVSLEDLLRQSLVPEEQHLAGLECPSSRNLEAAAVSSSPPRQSVIPEDPQLARLDQPALSSQAVPASSTLCLSLAAEEPKLASLVQEHPSAPCPPARSFAPCCPPPHFMIISFDSSPQEGNRDSAATTCNYVSSRQRRALPGSPPPMRSLAQDQETARQSPVPAPSVMAHRPSPSACHSSPAASPPVLPLQSAGPALSRKGTTAIGAEASASNILKQPARPAESAEAAQAHRPERCARTLACMAT